MIATPLSLLILLVFVSAFFNMVEPAKLYTMCITGFGISVTMARLAFAFKPQVRTDVVSSELLYAGEKFSLAAIICIQLLFVALARQVLRDGGWLHSHPLPTSIADVVLGSLWSLISGSAVWTWHWAYCAFQDQLWENWRHRIDRINAQKT